MRKVNSKYSRKSHLLFKSLNVSPWFLTIGASKNFGENWKSLEDEGNLWSAVFVRKWEILENYGGPGVGDRDDKERFECSQKLHKWIRNC